MGNLTSRQIAAAGPSIVEHACDELVHAHNSHCDKLSPHETTCGDLQDWLQPREEAVQAKWAHLDALHRQELLREFRWLLSDSEQSMSAVHHFLSHPSELPELNRLYNTSESTAHWLLDGFDDFSKTAATHAWTRRIAGLVGAQWRTWTDVRKAGVVRDLEKALQLMLDRDDEDGKQLPTLDDERALPTLARLFPSSPPPRPAADPDSLLDSLAGMSLSTLSPEELRKKQQHDAALREKYRERSPLGRYRSPDRAGRSSRRRGSPPGHKRGRGRGRDQSPDLADEMSNLQLSLARPVVLKSQARAPYGG
ncbi:hypothetical protein JCM10207_003766 [Rhodosporidiobolus poonsookiae]